MSDALTFVINVKSDDAIASVHRLKTSFAGLTSTFNTVKNIGLVQFSQALQDLSGSIKEAAAPGLNFEQGMADLSAITGIAGKDLDTLGIAAREVGKKSGIGAAQAVEAFKLLASNIDISAIGGVEGLKKLQDATITLSQAAGTDLPMAANTMSFALNQFQLPVSEAARVINVLGAGAKYGAAEIPDLAAALKDAGSVAAQSNVSIEQTTGAIEVLSQRGLKGSEAGNSLRNILLILQNSGLPGVDVKVNGLSASLKAMQKYMGDSSLITKLFGRENINAAQILISEADAVDVMTKRVTGTNVAYEQAAIRTQTYKHSLEQIKAKIDDFKIGLFKSTGALVPWVEVMGEAAAGVSRVVPALTFMKDAIGGAIGSIISLVKGLKAAKTAQDALNFAFTKSPWGAIITGAILLGGALLTLSMRTRELSVSQRMLNEVEGQSSEYIAREKTEADRLFAALKKTKEETKERKDIIQQINDKYGAYLKNINLEKAGVEEIASAYRLVATEIHRVAMAEAAKELLVKKNREIIDQEKKAADERVRNKQKEIANNVANSNPSLFGQGAGSLGGRNIPKEREQRKLIELKRERNYLENYQSQYELKTTSSTSSLPSPSTGKPLVPGYTETKAAKESALSSLGGDSHAIKNTYINFESFIHQNTNISENGQMSFSDMERMMRQFFYRMINDANNAN